MITELLNKTIGSQTYLGENVKVADRIIIVCCCNYVDDHTPQKPRLFIENNLATF